MKKLIVILCLNILFAQEFEVDGNLKVIGNIDASNQRITNVGSPTTMQDAVNSEFLQEALSNASYDVKKAGEYAPVTAPQSAIRPPSAPPKQRTQPDSKATEWAQQNDWFNKDREMTSFAFGVHDKLVAQEGLDPTSDAYYRRIDEKMRERFPEKFGEVVAEEVSSGDSRQNITPRTPSVVVAPATRSSGGSPRKVQLTATQVRLAKRLGVTPEQYARQVLELEKANG